MARSVKSCLQSLLKIVNSSFGIAGLAMIMYALWMVRVCQRDKDVLSSYRINFLIPWFVYGVLGIGVTWCIVACIGHFAAAYRRCLSCYVVMIFLLLLLETMVTADILLNHDWEKDFPEDPTGRLDDFKDFVKSNLKIFKIIGFSIVLAQVLSVILAMVLKSVEQDQMYNYDSDDDCFPPRLPLLTQPDEAPAYVVGDPYFPYKYEPWIAGAHEKPNKGYN